MAEPWGSQSPPCSPEATSPACRALAGTGRGEGAVKAGPPHPLTPVEGQEHNYWKGKS